MRTMTDQQIEQALFQTMEGEVVCSLMAGNDAQCFTTERYVEARDRWIRGITGLTPKSYCFNENDMKWHVEYARRQLRKFSLVVEVSPDVWTLKELADAKCESD
jgi:hypothetical protein